MNQKGFSPLIIIIATLAIGAVVGGVLVLQEKKIPSKIPSFESEKVTQQEQPSKHATSPIEPIQSPTQSIQPPRSQTQSELKSETRDPKLEAQSQRLHAYGIYCSGENTYGTSNSFTVNQNNPNILYVGIEGRGVYKSTDKGTTWKKIIKGLVAYPDNSDRSELCFPDIAAIYIHPADSRRLLMITSDITTGYVDWPYGETGGIWQSFDAGESWSQMIKGKINVAGSGSLLINPENSNIMYYPANPDPPTFQEAPIKESLNKISSVYKTINGGQTWKEINMPMLPGLQASVTAIDPKNSNHLLFFTQSHGHIYGENSITEVFLHKQYGILESFDAGETWTALGDRLPAPYRALFDGDVSKNNFQHLIIRPFLFGPEFPPYKTEQKSFYSIDGGKNFQQTPIYIWVGRYNPHDKNGNHLLGYYQLNGWIVESKDAGATWEKVGIPQEVMSGKVRVSNFVWDPENADIVYMTGDYGHIWKSTDGGKNWNNILNLNTLPK